MGGGELSAGQGRRGETPSRLSDTVGGMMAVQVETTCIRLSSPGAGVDCAGAGYLSDRCNRKLYSSRSEKAICAAFTHSRLCGVTKI